MRKNKYGFYLGPKDARGAIGALKKLKTKYKSTKSGTAASRRCPLCAFSRFGCDECPWVEVLGRTCQSWEYSSVVLHSTKKTEKRIAQIDRWIAKYQVYLDKEAKNGTDL